LNPDQLPQDQVRYATCAACGSGRIRFVHTVVHLAWPYELLVGRSCCERLVGDAINPARLETELKQAAMTRQRQRKAYAAGQVQWATRKWRRSVKGNAWITYKGVHVVVFPARAGRGWKFVTDGIFDSGIYTTESEAMATSYTAAFWAAERKPKVKVESRTRVEPQAVPCPPCLAALGLAVGATLDQIRSAFRRLARVTHPDVGGVGRDFVTLRRNYEQAVQWVSTNGKAPSGDCRSTS
jgi:hypothetical protein